MFIKIYFDEVPLFLCDKINRTIKKYLHQPGTIFINKKIEENIISLLPQVTQPKFSSAILLDKDFNKLKRNFFKHFELIKAGGGLVFNNDKEILMIYRRETWDLPKGKLDKGEKMKKCALREVKEETGLKKIKLKKHILTTHHTYEENGKRILKETHWYKMRSKSHQKLIPQTEEDITEIKWIGNSEIEKYLSNTYELIKDILNESSFIID